MSRTCFLALDQGGHSSRALLYSSTGELLELAQIPVEREADGSHAPQAVLRSLEECAAAALGKLPPGASEVRAGLVVQRSTVLCWDRFSGEPLSPALGWADHRGAGYMDALPESLKAEIRSRTGLPASSHYGASKLRWCLDHLPAVANAAADGRLACGPLGVFLAQQLLEPAPPRAEPTLANRTLLHAIAGTGWDSELLAAFGLPPQALPELVPSRYRWGRLRCDLRAVLHLVGGDQQAVVHAFGPPDPDTAYVNLGTGAFVLRPRALSTAPEGLLLTPGLLPGEQLTEGTVNGAAAALDWAQCAPPAAPPSEPPPLFLNAVGGLGAPFWRTDITSRFLAEPRDALSRSWAVIESILFLVCLITERMAAQRPLRQVVVTGGLARTPCLGERLAALLGVPVICADEHEATARGVATLLGAKPSPLLGSQHTPQPDPVLSERFRAWRRELQRTLQGQADQHDSQA